MPNLKGITPKLVNATVEVLEKYRKEKKNFDLKELSKDFKTNKAYISIAEQLVYDNEILCLRGYGLHFFSEREKAFTYDRVVELIKSKKKRNKASNKRKKELREQNEKSQSSVLISNTKAVCQALKKLQLKKVFSESEMEAIFRTHNVPETMGFILLHNKFIDVNNKSVTWVVKTDVNLKMVEALMQKLNEFNRLTNFELKTLDDIENIYKRYNQFQSDLAKANYELNLTKSDLKMAKSMLKKANEEIRQLKDGLSKSKTDSNNIDIKNYQEQIDNLKNLNHVLKGQVTYYKNNLKIAEEELHKLKNENFKPFDSNTKERDYTKPNVDENELESEIGDPFENKDTVNEKNPILAINERIKELKEENQKLKEEIGYKNDEIEEGKRVEQDLRNEIARKNIKEKVHKPFNAYEDTLNFRDPIIMDEFDSRNTTKTKSYKLRLFGKTIFEREIVR